MQLENMEAEHLKENQKLVFLEKKNRFLNTTKSKENHYFKPPGRKPPISVESNGVLP